ncbi:MAG: glycosyltransferase family 4 protein [Planctomycetota bacterium]
MSVAKEDFQVTAIDESVDRTQPDPSGRRACDRKTNVLVVGQTPPPMVGQWIMIEKILNAEYQRLNLFHVRMAFSDNVEQIGGVTVGKIFHLFSVIAKIWIARFRHRAEVLYYPPAGPNLVPVLRDIIILASTRWLFRGVAFHFHAGGVSSIYTRLPWLIKPLFKLAYNNADVGIQLSNLNPPDSEALSCRKHFVIPNGIDDVFDEFSNEDARHQVPEILFVGMIRETKGVFVLLEACHILRSRGIEFKLKLVGGLDSNQTQEKVDRLIDQYELRDQVELTGILRGDAKWQAYASADIFCFPTHYESESFGLVVIEAMQFELPVVATDWRAVPEIVRDGETGILVPVHSAQDLASALAKLIQDPELAETMGKYGREVFLERFTNAPFTAQLEEALCQAIGDS